MSVPTVVVIAKSKRQYKKIMTLQKMVWIMVRDERGLSNLGLEDNQVLPKKESKVLFDELKDAGEGIYLEENLPEAIRMYI